MHFVLCALLAIAAADAFDARTEAQLAAQHPEAVPVWREANRARERGDFERAAEGYARVRQVAPGFVHATRRLCGCEIQIEGRHADGIAHCEEALKAEESPENLNALARALVRSGRVEGAD